MGIASKVIVAILVALFLLFWIAALVHAGVQKPSRKDKIDVLMQLKSKHDGR